MAGTLNYHHLYAFWMIAETGSVTAAAKQMRVTHSTLSVQLATLETHLGGSLFERRGRGLVITPFGDEIHTRASEIFRLGRELVDLTDDGAAARVTLRVGVVATLPKTITCRLLEPALEPQSTTLDLQHGAFDRMLEGLAAGRLHVVLADQVLPQGTSLRLHAHELGETELLVFGSERLVASLEARFPSCLQGAPMLLPRTGSSLRRSVDTWLGQRGIRVAVVGEIDDAGTLRAFGLRGHGLFLVRAALASEVADVSGARRVGRLDGLSERYVAITRERTVRHPALVRLIERARARLDRD
ncbi:MAG: LysR family transcriptional regulator [Deltaproteobacteria bacterium]